MELHPAVRSWLQSDACGEIFLENAIAGVRLGLHTEALVVAAILDLDGRFRLLASAAASSPDFAQALAAAHVPLALEEMAHEQWDRGAGAGPPAPGDTPHALSDLRFVFVTQIHNIAYFMGPDQFEMLGFAMEERPLDSGDRFWTNVEAELRGRPEQERSFKPAGSLKGKGPLWFTIWEPLQAHCAAASAPEQQAESARDALGLVHVKQGQRLVAISFPAKVLASAVQRRPIFRDAGGNRRFMAASSVPSRPVDLIWGQTAHLKHLEAGEQQFDGVPERVVRALTPADFGDSTFTLHPLGLVPTTRGSARPCSDKKFRDVLRKANGTPRSDVLARIP